jgi:hypothetical protein
MPQLHFLGVLANAHTSVAHLDFAPCVPVIWPYKRLVRFVARQEAMPLWSTRMRVDMDFAVHCDRRDRVCVLQGHCDTPDGGTDQFREQLQREHDLLGIVQRRISLLRLFEPGNLMLAAEYFYERKGRRLEFNSSSSFVSEIPEELFKVTKPRAQKLNQEVSKMPMRFSHDYLNLAMSSLDQSYHKSDHVLAFLMLMIAFEALFNAGKQELRYRLCRGLAVLCGRTLDERRSIFRRAKEVYDNRSTLLHTGKQSHVTEADVVFIRKHLRAAILAAYKLDLSKDKLSLYLTEAGFYS